jgi:hypothetical protein
MYLIQYQKQFFLQKIFMKDENLRSLAGRIKIGIILRSNKNKKAQGYYFMPMPSEYQANWRRRISKMTSPLFKHG